jgi:hypothetical protein
VYGLAAVDCRGRVADRAVVHALGWTPGTRLDIRETRGLPVIRTDTHGVFSVTTQGHLRRHRQLAEVVWRYGHGWIGRVGLRRPLGRCDRAGDLVPDGESVGHFASVFLGAESVAARSEVR